MVCARFPPPFRGLNHVFESIPGASPRAGFHRTFGALRGNPGSLVPGHVLRVLRFLRISSRNPRVNSPNSTAATILFDLFFYLDCAEPDLYFLLFTFILLIGENKKGGHMANKLELTWIGKEKKIVVEPRILIADRLWT